MITTYSWLDQYKVIGVNTYPDFFSKVPAAGEKIVIQGVNVLTGEVVVIQGSYKLP